MVCKKVVLVLKKIGGLGLVS